MHRCEAQLELLPPGLVLGCWTLLSGVVVWWCDDTGLRYSCRRWLGLLEITLEDAILVSLMILGLGCGGRLCCGSLHEEACVTVIWSLRKLPGAVCKEKNLNGAC